jgi:hypothetical protein
MNESGRHSPLYSERATASAPGSARGRDPGRLQMRGKPHRDSAKRESTSTTALRSRAWHQCNVSDLRGRGGR